MLLRCCDVAVLLRCCDVAVLLRCCDVAVLRCCDVAVALHGGVVALLLVVLWRCCSWCCGRVGVAKQVCDHCPGFAMKGQSCDVRERMLVVIEYWVTL